MASHTTNHPLELLPEQAMVEANAHSGSNQAGLVKYILVNDIPLSLVLMILISPMKIKD
jgi:hypothetical protein